MKQIKMNQKLVFNKITVANLEIREMNSLKGGISAEETIGNTCPPPTEEVNTIYAVSCNRLLCGAPAQASLDLIC